MKFAFADPPYLGCGKKHYFKHHANASDCDMEDWHKELIVKLVDEYPDGWVLCMGSNNISQLAKFMPVNIRWGAWVKPFAVFKPNVNPAFAWEPVAFYGGRRGDRTRETVRDWISANITLKKGLTGAKPEAFCNWILDLLGYENGDQLDDLFPGTGIMDRVIYQRSPQYIMKIEDAEAQIASEQKEEGK